ncbi:2-hydroxyacid dehydrogenase [Maritalea mediterranea]|uniref:Glyoxylate/hydroxypyruvate reductase A n=1 Tax=Maritalea mediterranea TaxID=2909667 RepID=A0ABS9E3N0_9HYPH|nr:glyoxylate/hydroxypyruvate reductase A [Maritalea mediterranea]MCF4097480.1 glyoxylate/hydroxypyruvate reductase A [Maritalea mediterranea]
MTLLVHLGGIDEQEWADAFRAKMPNRKIVTSSDEFDPKEITYLYVWKPRDDVFDGLENLKVILSLGAGVDPILKHPHLPKNVPITRFVDDTLTQCMSDYVIANVTMHHRELTHYRQEQRAHYWTQYYPAPATDIAVGIMGLGQLGADAAEKLVMLGYQVNGWSRSEKQIDGVQSYAGLEQFDRFLADTDILVNLLPLTDDTRDILCRQTFEKLRRDVLPHGPVMINAARGGHQDENDVVECLRDGTLGAASLDVFKTEPLPKDSPLWDLDNCYITPHIAAISSFEGGVNLVAEQLELFERGDALKYIVDPAQGY